MNAMTALRRFRKLLTTPSLTEVDPQVRGFYAWEDGDSIVQPVGGAFLKGYAMVMESGTPTSAVRRIQTLPDQWRGFAMEGAGMAACIRGAVEPWHRDYHHRFLTACAERHGYMTYVGLGWAMARLPKALWPDLAQLDPLLGPLALDGYGFHEVFFNTERCLRRGAVNIDLGPWPGPRDHARQQLMQGVGRGLWFVAGGQPSVVEDLIGEKFAPGVHASLWAGIGLAASYAGGRDEPVLRELVKRSDTYWPELAQGAAFAVEARARAQCTVPHTQLAAQVLCGTTINQVRLAVEEARPSARDIDSGHWHLYEQWRNQIATNLTGPT